MKKDLKTIHAQVFLLILFIVSGFRVYSQELKPKVVVIKEDAVLRIFPNLKSPVFKKVPFGTVLEVEEIQKEWLKVKLPSDERGIRLTGYIHRSFVVYETEKIPEVEEKKEAEIPVEAKPRKPVVSPPQRPVITERKVEIPKIKAEKKLISIYVALGMDNVDGGDLNEMIRDTKRLYSDSNNLYDNIDFNCTWNEMKWLYNSKGEVILNFSPNIGLGLGVEYITKASKGTITQDQNTQDTINTGFGYYFIKTIDDTSNSEPEYRLRAIPISLRLHLSVPLSRMVALFFTGGVGYYLGNLDLKKAYSQDRKYSEDYFYNDGTYWHERVDDLEKNGTYSEKVSSKAVGINGGLGVDLRITSSISFIVEANYRYVNFKNWEGSFSDTYEFNKRSGWSDEGINNESGSESESASGKLWFRKVYDGSLSKYYAQIDVLEEEPLPGINIKNIRIAEINLNGFSLRSGIKISF